MATQRTGFCVHGSDRQYQLVEDATAAAQRRANRTRKPQTVTYHGHDGFRELACTVRPQKAQSVYDPARMLRNRAWQMLASAKENRAHNLALTSWTRAATQREEAIPTMIYIARTSLHAASLIDRGVPIADALQMAEQGIYNPNGKGRAA